MMIERDKRVIAEAEMDGVKILYTSKELQAYFKVTRQCIYNWRKEGMPSMKIGRLVRFSIIDVLKWINENKGEMKNADRT